MNINTLSAAILFLTARCLVAHAGLVLEIDDQFVAAGANSVRIPVRITGPDPLNAISLAFGLGDGGTVLGGTETAQIIGFSLDQTIWDTNSTVGIITTPNIGTPVPTPPLPGAATVLNIPGGTTNSFVSASGIVAYFIIDVSSKIPTSQLRIEPNIASFTSANGPNAAPISLSFRPGTLTITTVPEPGVLMLLSSVLGAVYLRRWRAK